MSTPGRSVQGFEITIAHVNSLENIKRICLTIADCVNMPFFPLSVDNKKKFWPFVTILYKETKQFPVTRTTTQKKLKAWKPEKKINAGLFTKARALASPVPGWWPPDSRVASRAKHRTLTVIFSPNNSNKLVRVEGVTLQLQESSSA